MTRPSACARPPMDHQMIRPPRHRSPPRPCSPPPRPPTRGMTTAPPGRRRRLGPRATARSRDFDLVAVLAGIELVLWLDRARDNAPGRDRPSSRLNPAPGRRRDDRRGRQPAPARRAARHRAATVIFTVQAGGRWTCCQPPWWCRGRAPAPLRCRRLPRLDRRRAGRGAARRRGLAGYRHSRRQAGGRAGRMKPAYGIAPLPASADTHPRAMPGHRSRPPHPGAGARAGPRRLGACGGSPGPAGARAGRARLRPGKHPGHRLATLPPSGCPVALRQWALAAWAVCLALLLLSARRPSPRRPRPRCRCRRRPPPTPAPPRRRPGDAGQTGPAQQRLRARIAALEDAAPAVELPGRVVADPSAGGRVQAPFARHRRARPAGPAAAGQAVKAGEVLAWLRPSVAPMERSARLAEQADVAARLAVARQRAAAWPSWRQRGAEGHRHRPRRADGLARQRRPRHRPGRPRGAAGAAGQRRGGGLVLAGQRVEAGVGCSNSSPRPPDGQGAGLTRPSVLPWARAAPAAKASGTSFALRFAGGGRSLREERCRCCSAWRARRCWRWASR